MKKLIITIISLFIIISVNAQIVKKQSIGISANLYSGYGFSYRMMQNKIGFQINLAPYLSSNNAVISTGVSFLYQLSNYEKTNLFLNVGNHLFFSKDNSDKNNLQYFYGAGPSIQFNLSENLFFEFMFGYGGKYKLIDESLYSSSSDIWYFGYTGGISILYTISKK